MPAVGGTTVGVGTLKLMWSVYIVRVACGYLNLENFLCKVSPLSKGWTMRRSRLFVDQEGGDMTELVKKSGLKTVLAQDNLVRELDPARSALFVHTSDACGGCESF